MSDDPRPVPPDQVFTVRAVCAPGGWGRIVGPDRLAETIVAARDVSPGGDVSVLVGAFGKWPVVPTPVAASLTPQSLFQSGAFTLHSGEAAHWKIDCDALTDADWATLAEMAVSVLPAFGAVEGVPRGGLRFAQALHRYVTTGPLLIAEDVVTTGASLEQQRAGREAVGVAVFARGSCPAWVRPLFTFAVAASLTPQVEPNTYTLRALAAHLGWGGKMSDAGIWAFIVNREQLLRTAQQLLETQHSNAPTAEAALRDRIDAFRASESKLAALTALVAQWREKGRRETDEASKQDPIDGMTMALASMRLCCADELEAALAASAPTPEEP